MQLFYMIISVNNFILAYYFAIIKEKGKIIEPIYIFGPIGLILAINIYMILIKPLLGNNAFSIILLIAMIASGWINREKIMESLPSIQSSDITLNADTAIVFGIIGFLIFIFLANIFKILSDASK